jgi:hypothetical protein
VNLKGIMSGLGGLIESVAWVAECSNSTAKHRLRRKIAQEESLYLSSYDA